MIRRVFRHATSSSAAALAGIVAPSAAVARAAFSTSHFAIPPAGAPGSTNSTDLIDSIRASHDSTSGLRRAEHQVAAAAAGKEGEKAKYRDGLRAAFGDDVVDGQKPQQQQKPGEAASSSSSSSGVSPTHFRAPVSVLAIGRDQLVLQLWQAFLSGRRALFLHGPDGVGTSTVAAQFAEHARRSGRFSCVQWFACTKRGANAVSVAQPALEQLRAFMRNMRQRREAEVLLVFDHAEQPVEVLQLLHASFAAAARQRDAQARSDAFAQGLSDAELRSHASRIHLLFTCGPDGPALLESVNRVQVPFSGSTVTRASLSSPPSQQQQEQADAAATTMVPLAAEFAPALFAVEPIEEVPALLLLERLIANALAEQGVPLAEELDNDCLAAAAQAVARVPLLLSLCGNWVAQELLCVARAHEARRVATGSYESNAAAVEARLKELVEGALGQVLSKAHVPVAAPAGGSEADETEPATTLSVSAAAASLCLASVRTLCCSDGGGGDAMRALVESTMRVLLLVNIGSISRALVDAVVDVQLDDAANAPLLAALKCDAASKAARMKIAAQVADLLRRSGFWVDEELSVSSSSSSSSSGASSASPLAIDAALRGGDLEVASKIADELRGVVHPAVAEGFARIGASAARQSAESSAKRLRVARIIAGSWPRRLRGGAQVTALCNAHHVEALFFPTADSLDMPEAVADALRTAHGSADLVLIASLFDRVAAFLAHAEGTHLRTATALWRASHKLHLAAGSNELAARAAADGARVMLASGGPATAADALLASGCKAALAHVGCRTPQDCVAAAYPLWATLVALRARMMPLTQETLAEFSAAAQVLENALSDADSALSRVEEETAMLSQEHFVLLVAWARCAEALKVDVPQAHWAKVEKLSNALRRRAV